MGSFMATVIDELLVRLGFDADTSGAASFDRGLGKVLKTAGQVGAVLTGVTAAAVGFLGKEVLNAASQFEQFETQLTTIEGSSDKAKKSLDWIADFAKKTPYEIDEVTDAFVKMKSYGIDPIEGGLLTSVGDMASSMNKSIDQAVEALADAVTGENERLKEFGITSSKDKKTGEITYYYNTSDGKSLSKTVQNDAKEISSALQGIMDEKFAGGMDAMSKTWAGTISNMKGVYTGFLLAIANAGVFDMLKDGLASLAAWIESNEANITAFALAIANGFKAAFETIGAVYDAVMATVSWFDANSQTIITTLQTIGTVGAVIATALVAMYAPAIAGFLLMQATGLLSFLLLQGAAIASAVATGAAWLIAFAPFLLIGAVIAVVIGLLWLIYNNWAQISAGISAEWARLTAFVMSYIDQAVAWVNGKVQSISEAFSSVVGAITGIWSGLWEGIKSMASGAIQFVIDKVQGLITLISGALGTVAKLAGFKMPSFSGASSAMGGGKNGGGRSYDNSVKQSITVSSAGEARMIAQGSITNALRGRNNGVLQ